MDPDEIGARIAEYVLGTSAQMLPTIHEVVERDIKATGLNLAIAFAWIAFIRLSKRFGKTVARHIGNRVFAVVIPSLARAYGLVERDVQLLAKDRFRGYKTAVESNYGPPAHNVGKYFIGCCTDMRIELPYEHVIPDPDDMALLGDEIDAEALAQLRSSREAYDLVTYPTGDMTILKASTCIFGFGSDLDTIIDEF